MARQRAVPQSGDKKWFFLTADCAFGQSLEKDAAEVVKANGGEVLGSVRHPFLGTDFSSVLFQAQGSGAKIIGLANAGSITIKPIKQAVEVGGTPKQSLADLLMFITAVHSLGLKVTQNLCLTEGSHRNLNDDTRAGSKHYFDMHKRMPMKVQAGQYSSVIGLRLDRAQARHPRQHHGGDGLWQRPRRYRLTGGRAKPGPGLHIHDSEPCPPERWPGRGGDCRARLPGGPPLRAGPGARPDPGP